MHNMSPRHEKQPNVGEPDSVHDLLPSFLRYLDSRILRKDEEEIYDDPSRNDMKCPIINAEGNIVDDGNIVDRKPGGKNNLGYQIPDESRAKTHAYKNLLGRTDQLRAAERLQPIAKWLGSKCRYGAWEGS